MTHLETLISNAMNTPESEIFFNGIQIVGRGTKHEYYIDPRTWTRADGLKVVLPFCFHRGHDWYVCPDCGQLHIAYDYGKRETGCCEDIDCERLQSIGESHIFIQRDPVFIMEPEESR